MSKFYRPNKPVLAFQASEKGHGTEDSSSAESEEPEEDNGMAGQIVNRKMPTPKHLLFVALLEHLCSVYESDPAKSKQLFQAISRRLGKLKMMNSLTAIDELSTIKSQYRKGFFGLMRGALAEINQTDPNLTLRDRAALLLQPRLSGASGHVSMADVLGFHTSRYRDEFVELGTLGQGAYGSVFQVKNKFDGCMYAVKKIVFRDTKPDIWFKVLREVKYLSSLSHPHVVRYYAAWLEQEPVALTSAVLPNTPIFEASSDDVSSSLSRPQLLALAYRNRQVDEATASDYEHSESIVFENASHASHITVLESGQNLPLHPTPLPVTPSLKRHCVVMYIQLELCVSTLAEWISSRNAKMCDDGQEGGVEEYLCRRIMHQIMKAVDYMHSQNIMHRDLKPKNIFLTYKQGEQLQVKVGDFGLSRALDLPLSPDISDVTGAPNSPMTPHPGAAKTPPTGGVDGFQWPLFTSGVGTTIYAAPEQLAGSQYNEKSDVYSLGLIMYELHQVFSTTMERVHSLTQARRGNLPESFKQQWPIHSQYIERMLSEDPEKRPTVRELLNGELFKSKEEIIKDLNSSLTREKDKVCELTNLVEAQRTEIAQLRREIADLKLNPRPLKLLNS